MNKNHSKCDNWIEHKSEWSEPFEPKIIVESTSKNPIGFIWPKQTEIEWVTDEIEAS